MDSVGATAHQEVPTIPRGRLENLFDVGPVLIEAGQARASMPTGPWLRGPDGRPSAAGLGVLVDDVLGQAALINRWPGLWSVTTELAVDVAAPLPFDGQVVNATASPVLIDDGGALTRAEVRDAADGCLAVATTWARFMPGIPAEILDPPQLGAVAARGENLADLLQVQFPDTGRLDLPDRPDLGNPQGVIHGGALFSLAVMSAERLLAGAGLQVASARVVYLRPAAGSVRFEPVAVHGGRSLGLVHVNVTNAVGALCTAATVTVRSATGPAAGRRPG